MNRYLLLISAILAWVEAIVIFKSGSIPGEMLIAGELMAGAIAVLLARKHGSRVKVFICTLLIMLVGLNTLAVVKARGLLHETDIYQAVLAVKTDPKQGKYSTYIFASTEERIRVLVTLPPINAADVESGSTIRVRGKLKKHGDLMILNANNVSVLNSPPSLRKIIRTNAYAATSSLGPGTAALIRGMSYGDIRGMPEQLNTAMMRSGLGHLVAVSGSNVAIVMAAVLLPLSLVPIPRGLKYVLAAVMTWFYLVLVGLDASVLRAVTMVMPLLFARFKGWRVNAIPALGLTIFIWLMLDPQLAMNFGFALSCVATSALLLFAKPCGEIMMLWGRGYIGQKGSLIVATPLVAQLACTPILLMLDPYQSLWTVPANLAAVPVAGMITVIGLVGALTAPFSIILARKIFTLIAPLAGYIQGIAQMADGLPFSHLAFPESIFTPIFIVLMLLASVLLGWVLLEHLRQKETCPATGTVKPRSRLAVKIIAISVVIIGLNQLLVNPGFGKRDTWQIAMCDVGQGDAYLVRSQKMKPDSAVLIDTGPEPDKLATCLNALHVEEILLFIRTHPHQDHIGASSVLTNKWRPKQTWSCPLDEAPGFSPKHPLAGAKARLPGLEIEVLWPTSLTEIEDTSGMEEQGGEGSLSNDCSLATLFTIQTEPKIQLLGLGDLEPEAQTRLKANLPAVSNGVIRIVKVAHHGSRRQDEALYRVFHPRLALISVGDNHFGHPSQQILKMFQQDAVPILRTDQDGNIKIVVEDRRIRIRRRVHV